jgi:hypothetical protein
MESTRNSWRLIAALAVSVGAMGCNSPPATAKNPDSFNQQYHAELNAEREKFIRDTQQRLDRLDNRIAQLHARIDHESQFVSPADAAEWKQELFDLRMEQQKARAELQRAQTVDDQQWEAMRGPLGRQVDRLEAGVSTVGSRIGHLFKSDERPPVDDHSERQPVSGQDSPSTDHDTAR